MKGFGAKLPLVYNGTTGPYEMLVSLKQVASQNLKMLLLTNPGERIMDPEFGVGVQTYLFSNFSENIQGQLYDKIVQQAATYMPAVEIVNITFTETNPDTNTFSFQIFYNLRDAGLNDLLEFTI